MTRTLTASPRPSGTHPETPLHRAGSAEGGSKLLRGAFRFARRLWNGARSRLVLTWYRALYEGLSAGRNVRLGKGVNISVVKGGVLRIGDDVVIESYAQITAGGTIDIGDGAFLGSGCVIAAADRIQIGKDALIAAYVTLRDQNHGYDDPSLPYRLQPSTSAPIVLGTNVWLGTHVTVLKGVTIGADAIVGANSVVTSDLPERTLCAGAPARVVRPIGSA